MKTWLQQTANRLLLLVLIFSIVENVVLFFRVRQLEGAMQSSSGLKPKKDAALAIGDKTPDIQLGDLNDNAQLGILSGTKLLFVFSTSCPACASNFDNWKELERVVGENRVLYISTDSLAEAQNFAAEKGINSRTLRFRNNEDKVKFKVYRVPQTLYVTDGTVKNIVVGRLPSQEVERFKNAFNAGSY